MCLWLCCYGNAAQQSSQKKNKKNNNPSPPKKTSRHPLSKFPSLRDSVICCCTSSSKQQGGKQGWTRSAIKRPLSQKTSCCTLIPANYLYQWDCTVQLRQLLLAFLYPLLSLLCCLHQKVFKRSGEWVTKKLYSFSSRNVLEASERCALSWADSAYTWS